jgi:hypothetical protein
MNEINARWYVYELINPINGNVFYVGKGTGNRIDQHEREAAKGVCSKKCNKINYIIKRGHKIKKQKVALFWDEQAAYDHETDLIAQYGLANLTNIMAGGQTAFDRRLTERKTRIKEPQFSLSNWLEKKKPDHPTFSRFAEWFKTGMYTGRQIQVTTEDPKLTYHCIITETVYNKILPMFWEKIKKDDRAIEIFTQRMKHHNVELVYGG